MSCVLMTGCVPAVGLRYAINQMTSLFKCGSIAAVAFACLAVGCGPKKPVPSTDVANQSGTPAASESQTTTVPTPPPNSSPAPVGPPPVPHAPVQPVAIAANASSDAVLDQLTQALRKYSMEKRRMPATIGEVISAGHVSGLPQPPLGKQYAIHKKQVSVVLVSK